MLTYHGELQQGTLWDTDAQGFKTPSNGRAITFEEESFLKQYNLQRQQLNEASRRAIDEVMKRVMPTSDGFFKELTDIKFYSIKDDISWLNDHPVGSDFYNDPRNFGHGPDEEADSRLGRLTRLLKECGLNVDISEIEEKVSCGISTPIVINLDGGSITTTSFIAGKTVFFDIDGDGVKERTAWISGNNAFLAIDTKGDGVINLFGGKNRGDGFAKLAELDSNGDGKIDKNDERFFDLLLWQDKNMDGVMDRDELIPAWEAGLESISLNYTTQNVWQNGNLFGEISFAIYQGKTVEVADIYFRFRKNSEPDLSNQLEAEKQTEKSEGKNFSNTDYAIETHEDAVLIMPTLTDVPII